MHRDISGADNMRVKRELKEVRKKIKKTNKMFEIDREIEFLVSGLISFNE